MVWHCSDRHFTGELQVTRKDDRVYITGTGESYGDGICFTLADLPLVERVLEHLHDIEREQEDENDG